MQKVTLGQISLALTAMASTVGQGCYCWIGSWLPEVSSQEEVTLQVSALQAPPGGLHGLQYTVMIRSVLYHIPLNGPLKASWGLMITGKVLLTVPLKYTEAYRHWAGLGV